MLPSAVYRLFISDTIYANNLTFKFLNVHFILISRDPLLLILCAPRTSKLQRDAHTREELQNQKLSNAIARIEQLDATAEQSRQSLQHDLVNLHNEFRDGLYSLEYQLTTKTRDLSDNIATISNKVSHSNAYTCDRLVFLRLEISISSAS